MFSNTASENTESRIDSCASFERGQSPSWPPSLEPDPLASPNGSTRGSAAPRPSLFSPRRRTLRARRRPTRRVWREASPRASRVRASRREATPPGGRRPGTHRPRDGRRLRGYPRGRSRPHPRRGRVPVPAERGGERGGGSVPAPVPVAVPATVPGVGPPCALLPGPAASTAPYAFASASRTFARCSNPQGRSPGARLESDSSRSFSMTLIQYASTSSVVLCVSDPSA